MHTLFRLAQKGDQRVVTTVVIRLEHADEDVGRWALTALADLAEKGDQHATTVVAMRLGMQMSMPEHRQRGLSPTWQRKATSGHRSCRRPP